MKNGQNSKIFGFLRENAPENKRYYYEKAGKLFKDIILAKIDIFDFCLGKVRALGTPGVSR